MKNRSTLAWLVLCAVIVRAFIPQGFMPGNVFDGTPVVMCSGGVVTTMFVSADGSIRDTGDTRAHDHKPCEFALAPIGSSPARIALPVSVSINAEKNVTPEIDSFPSYRAIRAHAPRAPPSLS